MIGVYVHVPFCRTICPYCDFVRRPIDDDSITLFRNALHGDMTKHSGPRKANTLFFGGGTPSLLSPGDLALIVEDVRRHFELTKNAETSLEANPDDVTPELADAWRDIGINRVSLGVQSFDDAVLNYLGRRHDAGKARLACEIVAERFDNWSMDLIFGAHPVDSWEATLDECVRFAPPHVSTYGLTFEAETPFAKRSGDAVNDEQYLRLYRMAHDRLRDYDHYEVSNYARRGYQCRHNLIYWHNESYAGIGPGAYSYIDCRRSRKLSDIDAYLRLPGVEESSDYLKGKEVRVETVIQHLRLREGLRKTYYRHRFRRDLDADFGQQLRALADRGLITIDAQSVRPTWRGYELNNEIGLALVD